MNKMNLLLISILIMTGCTTMQEWQRIRTEDLCKFRVLDYVEKSSLRGVDAKHIYYFKGEKKEAHAALEIIVDGRTFYAEIGEDGYARETTLTPEEVKSIYHRSYYYPDWVAGNHNVVKAIMERKQK